jgi:hypothetical protein
VTEVVVTTNAAELSKMLQRIPSAVEVELHRAMTAWGNDHLVRMRRRMRADGEADSVRSRTGLLFGSFQKEIRRAGGLGGLRLKMFSAGVKYADIQERGGIIRPKKAKYLAIPTPAVKTPAGVARYKSPRDYPGETYVWRSKRGSLWIAESKDGKVRLLWHLVKSVRIKGRLGWFDTWRGAAGLRRDMLKAAAARALRAAGAA